MHPLPNIKDKTDSGLRVHRMMHVYSRSLQETKVILANEVLMGSFRVDLFPLDLSTSSEKTWSVIGPYDLGISFFPWGDGWVLGHGFRAFASHVRHHLQTPRTAARPSSLRSVPSGLPMTMEKIQKKAAVQAKRRMAMLRNGERIRMHIEAPTV